MRGRDREEEGGKGETGEGKGGIRRAREAEEERGKEGEIKVGVRRM